MFFKTMRDNVSESLRNIHFKFQNCTSIFFFFVVEKKIVESLSIDMVKIWKSISTIYSVVKSGLYGNSVSRIGVYNFQQKMLERKNSGFRLAMEKYNFCQNLKAIKQHTLDNALHD